MNFRCSDYILQNSNFSSPRLILDAVTGIELELIADIDMHLFIEKKWEESLLILLKSIGKQMIKTSILC